MQPFTNTIQKEGFTVKIIHTSDLHLDSPLTTRLDSTKVRERKSELLISFKSLTEGALACGASAVIIAGDLFDSERVGKRTLKNVVEIIGAAPSISFYYLPGNHERDALSASGVPLPENLFIFGKEWTYFSLNGTNIIGRSETAEDMFSEIKLTEDERNVIVLHGELRDRSDAEGAIGKRELEALPIDYVALGHYHSYSKTEISARCNAVYCGTPEPRGFDEAFECGYVEISVGEHSVEHKFKKSAKRHFHIIEVDASEADSDISLVYKIEKALAKIPKSDLVRIVLTGERELGKTFNTDTLLSSIKGGYYYAEIKDTTKVRISADDFKNDVSLKGEFIRGTLADGSLSDAEKEAIISLGLEVLFGSEG